MRNGISAGLKLIGHSPEWLKLFAEAEMPESRLLTAKRRAQRGLDAGRASATLLQSGECPLESGLHAHTESVTDLTFMGWPVLDGLLDGV